MPEMKKTILVCLAIAVLLFTVNVCAADNSVPEIKVISNENSVISVSGETDANARVTLLVLNPGATEAQLAEAVGKGEELSKYVQYMSVVWPDGNGKYEFNPVNMNDNCDGGGLFTFIVTVGEDRLEPIKTYFYFYDAKLDVLGRINAEPCDGNEAVVREAYTKMGLSEYPLYKNGDISEICKALDMLKAATDTGKLETNLDTFADALREAAFVAAYNSHNEELVLKGGKIAYGDEHLALTDTQLLSDYSDINSTGISLLHDKLISGSYSSSNDVRNALEELVAFYGVEYYKSAGFGHLDSFFKNYEAIYKEYGFKLDRITTDNRNYVYQNLLSDKVDSLSKLSSRFNALIKKADGDDGGSSSSHKSSGGSSFGGSVSAPTVTPDSYIIPEDKFIDLAGFSWAEKEIEELRDKGIINGRTAEIFAPADYVTRAEFLKMLMCVFNIQASTDECRFTDVENDWSRPYIIAALESEIANGITDTLFDPCGRVTREMSTVFAVRALESQGNVLEGDENLFTDDALISEYAKDSVYKLKKAGIVSGVGDNSFNPQGCLTRAEAAKIIHGIMLYN